MPILNIEIVGDVDSREGLSQRIADAAGEALQSKPHGTWVKLHFIDPMFYAENSSDNSEKYHPVIVSIIQANPPTGDERQRQISSLTTAIAIATGREPDSVHIIIEPPALGRVAFGGKLQT